MKETNLTEMDIRAIQIFEIISALGEVSLKLDINQNWYVATQLNCRNQNIETNPFQKRSKNPSEAICLSWDYWLKMQEENWVIIGKDGNYVWNKYIWKKCLTNS